VPSVIAPHQDSLVQGLWNAHSRIARIVCPRDIVPSGKSIHALLVKTSQARWRVSPMSAVLTTDDCRRRWEPLLANDCDEEDLIRSLAAGTPNSEMEALKKV
jgi:hypothetical protein